MKLFFSSLALAASLVSGSALAAVVTSVDFSSPVTTGPTQAPGIWYTDRYAPSGFQSVGSELVVTVSSTDSATNRPSGFSGAFYNTQGRKYDLGAGAKTLSVDLFLDNSWVGSGQRQAGLWATAFDDALPLPDAISAYPIIEYFNNGFRGYDVISGLWISLGAGLAGQFNNIGFELDEVNDQWQYYVNGVMVGAVGDAASDYLGNGMVQAYNNYGPNDQTMSRDVRFDNFLATDGQDNRVPEPGSLALAGFALLALGTVTTRRRQAMTTST